jgi:uncharacterized protein (TIGR03435 family)
MVLRVATPLLALLAGSYSASAQQPSRLEFEAASIKPSSPPAGNEKGFVVGCRGGPGSNDPGLLVCENYSHVNLVLRAYDIEPYRLSAPDWMLATRFDLRARIPEGTTKQQFLTMLQNLLADRFKVAVHHETRQISRYELTVGKGGPKFKEAAPPAPKGDGAGPPGPLASDQNGYPILKGGMTMAIVRDGDGGANSFSRAHRPE